MTNVSRIKRPGFSLSWLLLLHLLPCPAPAPPSHQSRGGLTLQDGDVDVWPDLRQDIGEARQGGWEHICSISRGEGVLGVTAPSAASREVGGHSFPRSGLLGGDPKYHEREEEHCPVETQGGCPHGDLE